MKSNTFNETKQNIDSVAVYCSSSRLSAPDYMTAACELGLLLAKKKITVVYGGGGAGLMGRVADGVLAGKGRIIGVIPEFMVEMEWARAGLTRLEKVTTMAERKERMVALSKGVIALPGGCGTLEELIEVITLKRLGLFCGPIVIVNARGFFDSLLQQLNRCIEENMMAPRHRDIWTVVDSVDAVPEALDSSVPWSRDARQFAAV